MASRKEIKMETKTIKCRLTFTEELLGSQPNNPDIYRDFIASKAPDALSAEEEIASIGVDAFVEKGMSVFHRDADGDPVLYDYQIKGFFKEAAASLRKVAGTKCSAIKAFKKEIDGLVFVYPRMIKLNMPAPLGECPRSLRADTAQGPRTSLANSESAPAGTTIDIEIDCLTPTMESLVRECLEYGRRRGIGQWRNASKGRFVFEEI